MNGIVTHATSFTKQKSPHHPPKKHTSAFATQNLTDHDIGTTLFFKKMNDIKAQLSSADMMDLEKQEIDYDIKWRGG